VLRVGIPAHNLHVASDTTSGRVAGLVLVDRPVNFSVAARNQCQRLMRFYSFQIRSVSVSCDLHAVIDPTGAILHELFGPAQIATAD
jgi:hypothetical protein